jgi:hypothetical protein
MIFVFIQTKRAFSLIHIRKVTKPLKVTANQVKYTQILNKKHRRETKMKLKIGSKAPDFKLKSHLDNEVSLSDFRGKTTVLAFFPLAWTPV